MQANRTMQMTKIERPALGLVSLVAKRGMLAYGPTNMAAILTGASGVKAYRVSPVIVGIHALCAIPMKQHDVKTAVKHVSRINETDWKHSIRRPRKPLVANG